MEKLIELLKNALIEKPKNRVKLVKEFQESVWSNKDINDNNPIIKVLVNLAHDIEFIDYDTEYDGKLKEEITETIKKIEILSNEN
jgi:hypothetical protein